MRTLGGAAACILFGLLLGLLTYHVLGVTGFAAVGQHLNPEFASAELRAAAAEENRRALEVVFGTIIAVGGITLTCTVGYLALPQERFSETAQRLAVQAFAGIYVASEEYDGQLQRARKAVENQEKSRASLIAFHTLISIPPIAPWTFRPCTKELLALGNGPRNLWRGWRIAVFARAGDVALVAWLAGLSALAVVFAGYFLVLHGALDPALGGPWPVVTDIAQVAGFFTLCALVLVMGVAITRATTGLSVRRAIDDAREQEEGRLADEAGRVADVGLPQPFEVDPVGPSVMRAVATPAAAEG